MVEYKGCVVDDCGKPLKAKALGYCNAHYLRWRRYGDPLLGGRPHCMPGMTVMQRIEHVGWRETPSGCWEWRGSGSSSGHPEIRIDRKLQRVHRLMYEETVGPIPDGYEMCHKCDNPPCINPEHLFPGTHLDNMRDMIRKGRRRPDSVAAKGSRHWGAKLTEELVSELREKRRHGAKYTDLMSEYGITKTTVGDIVRRRTWRHIDA